MKNYIAKFNSVHELHAYCENAQYNNIFKKAAKESIEGSEKWTGTKNWDTAQTLLLNGDSQYTNKIKSYFVKCQKETKGMAPRFRPAVVGVVPIVPAYLAGSPKAMLARTKVTTRAKVITVIYNTSAACNITADQLAESGAKMLAAIEAIEKSGIRVNLYVAMCTKESGEGVTMCTRVKSDGQRLNIAQAAYCLANPSFFRRHSFRIIETIKGIKKNNWPCGYGYPQRGKEAKEMIKACNMQFDAIIDFYTIKDYNWGANDISNNIIQQCQK